MILGQLRIWARHTTYAALAFIEFTEYSKSQKSFTSFKVTSAQNLIAEEILKIANPDLSFLPTLGKTEAWNWTNNKLIS